MALCFAAECIPFICLNEPPTVCSNLVQATAAAFSSFCYAPHDLNYEDGIVLNRGFVQRLGYHW